MASKSRVILYAELRKKISDINQYSFDAKKAPIEEKKVETEQESKEETKSENSGIKSNTFSMSIDELIKEHNRYDSKTQEKETQTRYHQKKKENKKNKRLSPSTIIIWSSIAVVIVVFFVFLTLILLGVI